MSNAHLLRISTPANEGVMRASKWLKHQVLLDAEEMRDLFAALAPFEIFVVSEPVTEQTMMVEKEDFLRAYEGYAETLKAENSPDESGLRRYFSSIFLSPVKLYAMEAGKERLLVKTLARASTAAPPLFRFGNRWEVSSHGPGKDSITWGVQFSYPQLLSIRSHRSLQRWSTLPNFPTALYQRLAKWLRAIQPRLLSSFKVKEVMSRLG
jgi:hypothetical protein